MNARCQLHHNIDCPICTTRVEVTERTEQRHKCELHVGDISISKRNDGTFWLEHDSGEGMQTTEAIFAKAIKDFYRENF